MRKIGHQAAMLVGCTVDTKESGFKSPVRYIACVCDWRKVYFDRFASLPYL